jgi:hypothetical protein
VWLVASARFELYLSRRGIDALASAAPAEVTWRLLSGNNRDLGRAATGFADAGSCLLTVRRLQRLIDRAVAAPVRAGRVAWTWRVRLDGEDVAVSSRTYQRRVQAESACAVFLTLAHIATVTDAPRLVRC